MNDGHKERENCADGARQGREDNPFSFDMVLIP